MANVSVTNALNDNSATSDITLVGTNFTDLVNGLTDGTKDISVSAITAASTVTFSAGNMAIEGKAVDVVEASNYGIADGEGVSFVFDFVPSKIVLQFEGGGYHSTETTYAGNSTGHSVITITGTDTFTFVSSTSHVWANAAVNINKRSYHASDTSTLMEIHGGETAAQGTAYMTGTGTWTTSTKTFGITFVNTRLVNTTNFISVVAVAYK